MNMQLIKIPLVILALFTVASTMPAALNETDIPKPRSLAINREIEAQSIGVPTAQKSMNTEMEAERSSCVSSISGLSPSLTAGEIISAAGLFVASLLLLLNWRQLRKNAAEKRAHHLVNLFGKYLDDPDTAAMFYKLEWNRFDSIRQFHDSPEERQLDRLLTVFDRIAALYEMGVIARRDLRFVEYEFVRMYENSSVQEYVAFVNNWCARQAIRGGRFTAFQRVARLIQQSRGADPAIGKPH